MPANANDPAAILSDIKCRTKASLGGEVELGSAGRYRLRGAEQATPKVNIHRPCIAIDEVPLEHEIESATKGIVAFL